MNIINHLKVLYIVTILLATLSEAYPQTSDPQFIKYMNHPWVDSVMNTLSTDQQIAQCFWVAGYSNGDVSHEVEISDLIRKDGIGGMVFFQGTAEKQAELTNYYQKISKVPLLFCLDAEWGIGMRLDNVEKFPFQMTLGAIKRLEYIQTHPELKEKLWIIVRSLQKGLREAGLDLGKTESPVTPVYMKSGVSQATQMIYDLRENYGIFCSVVIYPVVPKDVVMLRLIPTAGHSLEDVEYTVKAFSEIKGKVDRNEYPDKFADFRL